MTLAARSASSAWRAILLAGWCLAPATAGAAPALRASAAGPAMPVITDEQRALLGIRFGPDAPIDLFQAKNGQYYITSAGSLGQRGGKGRPAAWVLHVDSQLTRVLALHGNAPASGPDDVQTIMTTHAAECGIGRHRLAASDQGGAACARYFDRDYAGGGTYFRCPDNQTSVLFYHGENHTAPDGSLVHGGWFGLGLGVFNADETALSRSPQLQGTGGAPSAQLFGMNMATAWTAGATAPPQEHPFNGVPSAVAGPDGYLYVFYGNATLDPAYNPSACSPACLAVARMPVAVFCRAVKSAAPVRFQNWYRGGWSQPAVLEGETKLGFGAGGAFTPILTEHERAEHGGTVTYLASRHLFLMTRLTADGINFRSSADGLRWSGPQLLVPAPAGRTPLGDGERLLYPKIVVVHDARGQEQPVLTYVLATDKPFWKWAELMRQPLTLSGG